MKSIFINIPVNNLQKSIDFVKKLGFSIDPQMTSEENANVIIEENIYIMLVTKSKFQEYANKEIADSSKVMECVIALSFESKAEVDKVFKAAIKAGGKEALETKDYGFMYMRTFEDLDGHIWELFWKK